MGLAMVDCSWSSTDGSVAVVSDRLFVYIWKVESRGQPRRDKLVKWTREEITKECQGGRQGVPTRDACRSWVLRKLASTTPDPQMRDKVAEMLHSAWIGEDMHHHQHGV